MKKYVFLFLLIIIYILTKNYVIKKEVNKLEKQEIFVDLYKNGEIKELSLENYVVGVVACEMPASFEEEALKAMSVAARTYALNRKIENRIEISTSDQCYIDEEDMMKKWKNDFAKYHSKIEDVTKKTIGEYISYDNLPIKALYFSTSNGYTENVENVFYEKISYLESVESKWDVKSSSYFKEVNIDIQEFKDKFNIDSIENIEIISRNETNRVEKIQINDKTISGVEFRKILNLRSTDFDIEMNKDNLIIKTRGYGHGVGMSQYGANGMAKEGYNYKDILKHYYKNVEIINV